MICVNCASPKERTEYPNLSHKWAEEFPHIVTYKEDGQLEVLYVNGTPESSLELHAYLKQRQSGFISDVRIWCPLSVAFPFVN